ncbi:MAG: tetratricopeptide repeat protein [Planctomycetota bacterium]|nr:tetratricopeptide repeat protein [Planctomycetota bacterium]
MNLKRWKWGSAAIVGLLVTSGCHLIKTAPPSPPPVSLEDSAETRMSLAKLRERHGETTEAAELYQAILRDDPQNQAAHHRLAVIAAQGQQLDLADHHFEQALASGKPTAELLSDRAYAHYLRDELEMAENAARASLALEPHNAAAHNNLALILGDKGQFDASLAEFREAVDEAEAQSNFAYVKAMAGDLAGAEKTYHHALEKNSTLRPAAHALLELHDRRKGVVRDVAPQIAAVGPRSEDRAVLTSFSSPAASPTAQPIGVPGAGEMTDNVRDTGVRRNVAPSVQQVLHQQALGWPADMTTGQSAAGQQFIPSGEQRR